jgi:hypothetical protein
MEPQPNTEFNLNTWFDAAHHDRNNNWAKT